MKEILHMTVATFKEGIRSKAHYLILVSTALSILLSIYISFLSISSAEITFAGFSLYFTKLIVTFGMLFFMISSLYGEKKYKTYHIFLAVMHYPFYYIIGRFLGYNILFGLLSIVSVAVTILVGKLFFSKWLVHLLWYCINLDISFFMISALTAFFYVIFSSSIITLVLSILSFVAGHFSFSYYLFAVKTGKFLWIYYLVPNVWLFSNELDIIHTGKSAISIPATIYGISYGLFVLLAACLIFWSRRDF